MDGVVERDIEVDAADYCTLLDLYQELKLLAELLLPIVGFGGDELDVDFVSGVLDGGDPLDEFHEVAGLMELADVRVGDRYLRCSAQVRD